MSTPEETRTTSFPGKLSPASRPLPAPSTAQARLCQADSGAVKPPQAQILLQGQDETQTEPELLEELRCLAWPCWRSAAACLGRAGGTLAGSA